MIRIRSSRYVLAVATLFVALLSASAHAQDLGGHWTGEWHSCRSSHRGKLSATFRRIDQDHVEAKFRGTFARVIPFRYRAVLNVVDEQPGTMQLAGSKKLGPIMGSFSYNATIVGDQFNADYSSRRDHGVWSLRR